MAEQDRFIKDVALTEALNLSDKVPIARTGSSVAITASIAQILALGPTVEGPTGEQGIKGDSGNTGPQGIQGVKGDTGDTGPQGTQGQQGPKGDTGDTGTAGVDGNTVLYGTEDPGSETGTNGDFYINTTDHKLFGPKISGAWPSGIALVGPPGQSGAQGETGPQGQSGGSTNWRGAWSDTTFALYDAVSRLGSSYVCAVAITAATGVAPESDGTHWQLLAHKGDTGKTGDQGIQGAQGATGATGAQGIQGVKGDTGNAGATGATGAQGTAGATGAAGTNGKTIIYGTAAPTTEGVDGDFYIRTSTNFIYGPKATTWPTGISLVGPTGATGAQGTQGIQGTTGTTGAQGATGATGAQGIQGVKGDTGNAGATGATGAQGTAGATGAAGIDGKTVRNGAGTPSSGLGVDGDFYIDTTNAILYGPKTSGAWGSGGAIVTPTSVTTLTSKNLKNYKETSYALATSGTIATDLANGNIQTCAMSGSATIKLPAASASNEVLSLTLWVTGPSSGTLALQDSAAGSNLINMGATLATPGSGKRSMIVCESINGSYWGYNQVFKEA